MEIYHAAINFEDFFENNYEIHANFSAINAPVYLNGNVALRLFCGGAILTAEQTVTFFNINQRAIFQLIEKGAAHFAEIEAGVVMICLSSISAILQISNNEQTSATTTTEEF